MPKKILGRPNSAKNWSLLFTVALFGLTNAPAAFMSMMDNVVKDYLGKFVRAYLDDIFVYSKTWDEHVQHVRKVLQKLKITSCLRNYRNVRWC